MALALNHFICGCFCAQKFEFLMWFTLNDMIIVIKTIKLSIVCVISTSFENNAAAAFSHFIASFTRNFSINEFSILCESFL